MCDLRKDRIQNNYVDVHAEWQREKNQKISELDIVVTWYYVLNILIKQNANTIYHQESKYIFVHELKLVVVVVVMVV